MQSWSSQSTGPVHILDLPNEILGEICVYVRGAPCGKEPLQLGDISYSDDGREAIKNTRLVCRKLCEASSHLLIPAISVSMSLSSLARLDQISRHPWIATGVRSVRVVMSFFSTDMAQDFGLFLIIQQEILDRAASLARAKARSQFDLIEVDKCRAILDSWELLDQNSGEIREGSLASDLDREYILIIKHAYEKYQHAFAEQEQMRADGSFVRAVADAMARMPVARCLVIDDGPMPPRLIEPASFAITMATPALFLTSLVQPISWAYAQEHGFDNLPLDGVDQASDTHPIELCSQIPLAVHNAGVMLTDVHYKVVPFSHFSRLIKCDQDLDDLRAAMRQLKSFRIAWPRIPQEDHTLDHEDEMRRLIAFVEAFTDTDSIESIAIDMGHLWPPEIAPLVSAGSLLLTRAWPRLRRLRFSGPLEFRDLEAFFAQTQGRIALDLHRAHLIRGSWAEVIDLVDAKGLPLTIKAPKGVWAE
ncbi:hypothetical protein SLS62_004904 [Diatrype stigma]|uniref:Uncharacterized protein n=1 Tax=Diatrype stigma TaxID=117547 RepID=A0AAN9YQ55_9PEZI